MSRPYILTNDEMTEYLFVCKIADALQTHIESLFNYKGECTDEHRHKMLLRALEKASTCRNRLEWKYTELAQPSEEGK